MVKRSNKVCEALKLPKVLNLNPRSIYNKLNEFATFVTEEDVDLVCMSESWEREKLTLDKVIKIDNYQVISNVFQRKGKGGRPAIIVNSIKFDIENLTQTVISIPWGVEAVWAVLTPKNVNNASKVKKIVVGSIYSKPNSRKKSVLLDHISEVYNFLNSKYKSGLDWIVCGDTNDLKLDSILQLNPSLKQVVKNPTRMNPPRILDPIITTLSRFYHVPQCLPPLDSDPDGNGKPSDHQMIIMTPISVVNNTPARTNRVITFRPFSNQGQQKMQSWLSKQNWNEVAHEDCAHQKAEILQKILVNKYNEFFPEKTKVITNDDQPFFNDKLVKLKRKKCREYTKNRRSDKWKKLSEVYKVVLAKAKKDYYRRKIKNLRKVNPRKWYNELKKLTSFDQHKAEQIIVEDIKHLTEKEQAEKIADKFSAVSQEYDKLMDEDIIIPMFDVSEIPCIEEEEVRDTLKGLDSNKANVKDDIPARILKQYCEDLAKPVAFVINSSIRQGKWPDIFKIETVTPVPKEYPQKNIDQLRNISGLVNLDKVSEKIISKIIISDMKTKMDPSQFANQKGLSIQHYLVKMIDRVLQAVDKNSKSESCAVLATMVDWKQAFPRQCPKLGVESFIKNGVRPSLIPLLVNYFQDRKMKVKWHGEVSTTRDLNGGGPQGSTFGIWEYLSQSNDNADCVDINDRFKFVDDLTFLEIINLLSVGLATYNIKAHIPSDIPAHNQVIKPGNLKSQKYLEQISDWTKKMKMKLNLKKTKSIIFNFTKKHQFTTKMSVENQRIEIVREAQLLGTVITDDLKWNKNTKLIVRKAYARMQLLNKAANYTSSRYELKNIYLTFIRSVLEQSAVVWHSSLSKKNVRDLERVQKAAVRVILGNNYRSYENGLVCLNIETLEKRRETLCLKFAKNCLKNDKVKQLFPRNNSKHKMKKRKVSKKFKSRRSNTKRYKKSSIPYMINLLNNENEIKISQMEEN